MRMRTIGAAAAGLAAVLAMRPAAARETGVYAAGAAAQGASRWTLSPANPIIAISRPPRGLSGGGKGPQIWNDPSVLREGNEYVMYASMGHGGPKGVAIYRLRSGDGLAWTVDNGGKPVLEPGDRKKKDFDWFGVETPSVIRAGNEYHMYYSAYPDGKIPLVTMGHAVSSDGVHWQKRGELRSITSPVGVHKGNPWGRLARGEPAALYRDGTFYLYFTDVRCRTEDCKTDVPVERGINVATSRDGHQFEVRGSGAPILLQGGPYRMEDRWEGYSTPAVALRDGRIELFVDVFRKGRRESIQSSLAHFRSADGVRFELVESDIVTPGPEWCAVSVRSPAVLADGATWKLWFAGDNWDPDTGKPRGRQVEAGIGLATAPIR